VSIEKKVRLGSFTFGKNSVVAQVGDR